MVSTGLRVYIAAPFELQSEAFCLRRGLLSRGIHCTARWIDQGADTFSAEWARRDKDDVARADMLVALNPEAYRRDGTGGRHVEFGLALMVHKPIVLIGTPTNIFHELADVLVPWGDDSTRESRAGVAVIALASARGFTVGQTT